MKIDKRGFLLGWETLVTWAVIIAIAIGIMVIMIKSSDVGKSAWDSIKNVFSFT